jgi:hypothetical protein
VFDSEKVLTALMQQNRSDASAIISLFASSAYETYLFREKMADEIGKSLIRQ